MPHRTSLHHKAAEPARDSETAPATGSAASPTSRVLALQRNAGNAAVASLLEERARRGVAGDSLPMPVTPSAQRDRVLQREPEPAAEPGAGTDPAEKPKVKLKMDLASGKHILQAVFGSIKTIVAGQIQVLSGEKFREAYDKIYGKGPWSWEKYVIPTYGSLNGFAKDGVNYINKDSAGLHTIVHEMLHNNDAADWRDEVGPRWNEGATEVLTQEACAKFDVDAPVTYPGESPVVREAISQGLSLDDLTQAYLKGGAKKKVSDWADKNCVSPWATIKAQMEAKNWAAAKAALQPKPPTPAAPTK